MNATVLAYCLEGKELRALKELCREKNVRLRAVKPEDHAQPVGALCGAARRAQEREQREEEIGRMLVFAHFPGRQFDSFFSSLRDAKLGVGALKAMLTPVNAAWDGYRLYKQLSDERAAMLAAVEKEKARRSGEQQE